MLAADRPPQMPSTSTKFHPEQACLHPAPPCSSWSTSCNQITAPLDPEFHRGASEAALWSSFPSPLPSFTESFIIISFFLCFFSIFIHFYNVNEICPIQKTWKKKKREGKRGGRRKPSTILSIEGNYLPLCFDTQIHDI